MNDLTRVKRLVAYYTRKYGTSDPFEIADQLGVLYQIGNCTHEGCYMFLKNHRYIFLSNQLDKDELRLVMAARSRTSGSKSELLFHSEQNAASGFKTRTSRQSVRSLSSDIR